MLKKINIEDNIGEKSADSFSEDPVIQKMAAAGLHLGHKISKLHPRMGKYVVGVKNTIHIIDLQKTKEAIENSLNFISETIKKGGEIVLVGTKPPLRSLLKGVAEECGIPYVVERWLGGTFTNFKVIWKRLESFGKMQKEKDEGGFEKFSKKERIKKEKELRDFEKKFGGIKNLSKVPEIVFICDVKKDRICLKEAKSRGVKTIAIVHTNVDPTPVDFPIPANDDSVDSVRYILERVKEIVKSAKLQTSNSKQTINTKS